MELWEKVLKEYDEIVCIPMSSGLSTTCFTAISIAAEYKGRVQVCGQSADIRHTGSVLYMMQ